MHPGKTITEIARQSRQRLALLPEFVSEVKNWPQVLAARCGLRNLDAIEFRDGSHWRLYDLRPGLAVLREVYFERVYDAPFRLSDRGTVLDLGANVGLFTIVAAKKLVPYGRVIAVEPHPELAAILRQNLNQNGITNVQVLEAAASTSDGEISLHLTPHSLGASICSQDGSSASVTVRAVSLSQIVREAGEIDLLKADIEGAEWPILFESGAEAWNSIKRIAMEFHLDSADGRTLKDIETQLDTLGYRNIRFHRLPGAFGYVWAERHALS